MIQHHPTAVGRTDVNLIKLFSVTVQTEQKFNFLRWQVYMGHSQKVAKMLSMLPLALY